MKKWKVLALVSMAMLADPLAASADPLNWFVEASLTSDGSVSGTFAELSQKALESNHSGNNSDPGNFLDPCSADVSEWWAVLGSNQWPLPCESSALPLS
jgi:hypothetical protein